MLVRRVLFMALLVYTEGAVQPKDCDEATYGSTKGYPKENPWFSLPAQTLFTIDIDKAFSCPLDSLTQTYAEVLGVHITACSPHNSPNVSIKDLKTAFVVVDQTRADPKQTTVVKVVLYCGPFSPAYDIAGENINFHFM